MIICSLTFREKNNIKEEGEEGQKEGVSWPKIFEYNALHLCPTMSKLFLVCLFQNAILFVPLPSRHDKIVSIARYNQQQNDGYLPRAKPNTVVW